MINTGALFNQDGIQFKIDNYTMPECYRLSDYKDIAELFKDFIRYESNIEYELKNSTTITIALPFIIVSNKITNGYTSYNINIFNLLAFIYKSSKVCEKNSSASNAVAAAGK